MIEIHDIGNHVECDGCSKDFSASDECGGILFGSSGFGPCCEERTLKYIRKYNEEIYIKGRCPPGMSFRDWILRLRNGNNTITILTGEDARRALAGETDG